MSWLNSTPSGRTVEHRAYSVANCGGHWTDPNAEHRIVLHTTESPRGSMKGILDLWDSAERRGFLTVPHFTIDAGTKRVVQHRDLNGPACALEGCSSGVQTNGVPCVQVEICGYATESPTWPDEDLEFIGDWMAGVRTVFDFPLQSSVTFYSDKNAPYVLASYSSPGRLQGEAWRKYAGVLGHVHVPCNAHWDPGGINVGRILYWAAHYSGSTVPNTEELSMTDISAIIEKMDALSTQVAATQAAIGGWLQGERAYDGLVPIKTADDPAQYIVVIVPGKGFARVHLTEEAKSVLEKQQTLQAGAATLEGGHPTTYITLTDPAQVAWFKKLPII